MMWWRNSSRVDPDAPILPNGHDRLVGVPAAAETAEPESPSTASASALPAGRRALATAITLLRQATAAMERAVIPGRRLDAIVAEARRLDQLLADHAANYEHVLGAWLAAGSEGERPAAAPVVVGLNQRRRELDLDLQAARVALPGSQEVEQQAARCAADASCQVAETLPLAAVDAAREVIEAELVPAVEQVLRIEARLAGLVAALREAGDRGSNPLPGAVGVSVQISEMVRKAKREPGIPIDVDQGRRFIDALSSNASAVFE